MSKFHVNHTFSLESRRLFVLAGSVVEGAVKVGMCVHVPLNNSISISEPIHSIEFARRPGGDEDLCLCINCRDLDELELWRGLNIGDETLDVLPCDED